jgi:hypothetical protein
MPSFSDSSFVILSSPHTGFSRVIWKTSSRRFFGNAGRPGLRDFHRQNILNAVRCHLTNVSGFTITSASRHAKNFASATVARRYEAVVRRGLVLRSWNKASCFAEEQILGHQGVARGTEQPDERQQLRILQELERLSTLRTEFLRTTGTLRPFQACSSQTSVIADVTTPNSSFSRRNDSRMPRPTNPSWSVPPGPSDPLR